MNKREVLIYTDGSCSNKDKKAGGGVGIVMIHEDANMHRELSLGCFKCDSMSSARAEVLAIILALDHVRPGFDYIIHSDNQYCVKTHEEGWLKGWIEKGILDTKAHADLWMRFHKHLVRLDSRVKLKWVKGHNGHEHNEACDRLANEGRLRKTVDIDDGRRR